ncbi:MAG: hypothetical protein CFE24_11225 [Flavobacterium sp. BFFFF2]|nr:MAG: hypothetical protein CFE24_11225 [Flavobacterium sp. BFFFF2]
MKKLFALLALFPFLFSCTKDGETELPSSKKTLFYDKLDSIDPANWTSLAQVGTKKWFSASYSGNGYAQFSSYQSGQASNVAWLISKEIETKGETDVSLSFQTAQAFMKSVDNTISAYISTDYDGTNFQSASWIKLDAKIVTQSNETYTFVNSGLVNLSKYITKENTKIRVAFKAVGSGTISSQTATLQLDNIYVVSNY